MRPARKTEIPKKDSAQAHQLNVVPVYKSDVRIIDIHRGPAAGCFLKRDRAFVVCIRRKPLSDKQWFGNVVAVVIKRMQIGNRASREKKRCEHEQSKNWL